MHYHGPIVRPQTDADSLFIELTVGCTHNSCTFCNFYHGYDFRTAPLSQVEEDLAEASKVYPFARKIWASGGNPYCLPTEHLVRCGQLFRKYFPDAAVTTYARVDDLLRKSVEEMVQIKEAGIDKLVIGIESGDDEVLSAVKKGYTAADILEGCTRLEAAGVPYRVIYLSGLAGHGKAHESAERTLEILNQLHPYMMILTTVALLPGTELYNDWREGRFEELTERERLDEFKVLLEGLQNPIEVFSATSTNSEPFWVRLPEERKSIVAELEGAIAAMTDEKEKLWAARRHRMTTV